MAGKAHWHALERSYGESPNHRALGLSLRVEGAARVEVSMVPAPECGNRNGSVAGGVLATMVDSAVVQAVRTLLPPGARTWTLDLKVNFMRRAAVGQRLTATARVDYLGRSTAVGTAQVTDPDGVLLAAGMVTVSVRAAGPETPSAATEAGAP